MRRIRQRVCQRRIIGLAGRCIIRHRGVHSSSHIQPTSSRCSRVHVPPASVHVVSFMRCYSVERPIVWMTRVDRSDLHLAQETLMHVVVVVGHRRCCGAGKVEIAAVRRRVNRSSWAWWRHSATGKEIKIMLIPELDFQNAWELKTIPKRSPTLWVRWNCSLGCLKCFVVINWTTYCFLRRDYCVAVTFRWAIEVRTMTAGDFSSTGEIPFQRQRRPMAAVTYLIIYYTERPA